MKLSIKILLAMILVTGSVYTFAKPHTAKKANASDLVDRHLSGFNGVHIGGPFDVYITQGATESVKVEAPADVMDYVITEVNDGVLKIYNKEHHGSDWGNWFGRHQKAKIYISAKDLNSMTSPALAICFLKMALPLIR